MKNSYSWSFFDRIYCISLLERDDRQRAAAREFAAAGLGDLVEFVRFPRHPVNREEGIYTSHMHCLRKGLDSGARRILVFEDDVFFRRYDPERLRQALQALDSLPGWNGFFLGGLTRGSSRTSSPALVRIRYRSLAHAYALNTPFARSLVELPWCGVPFDELLHRHCSDFFAIYPMCAFQGLLGTENQRMAIARIRRFCGGLPLIQRSFEMYHNHKAAFIAAHCALVLFLLFAALYLW